MSQELQQPSPPYMDLSIPDPEGLYRHLSDIITCFADNSSGGERFATSLLNGLGILRDVDPDNPMRRYEQPGWQINLETDPLFDRLEAAMQCDYHHQKGERI